MAERSLASTLYLLKLEQTAALNATIKGSLLRTASLNAYTLVYDTYERTAALNAQIIYTPLLTGLVSYYKMDGSSVDALGANNGVDTGMTWPGDGKINSGANFNGSSKYIRLGTGSSLNLVQMTFSAWIRPLNYGNYYMVLTRCVSNGGSQSTYELRLESGSGTLNLLGASTSVSSGFSPPVNQWTHICFTRTSGRAVIFYRNGVAQGTGTLSNVTDLPSDPTYLGTRPDGYAFNGSIDEVGIWDRVLTPTEVADLYNLGAANPYSFQAPTTGQLVGNYTVGASNRSIAFDGTNIWVTNNTPSNVSKIVESTGAVSGPYASGAGVGIAFDGTNIWTCNYSTNNLHKVDITTGAIVATYAFAPGSPYGMVFDGTNIWVTSAGSNSLSKVRISDGVILGTYTAGLGAGSYTLAADGTNIWVASYNSSWVTKIRASDGAWLSRPSTGTGPFGVCFDGANIWTANYGANTVTKIRASDDTILGTFSGGPSPSGPNGITFDGTDIWVANYTSNSVQKMSVTGIPLGNYSTGTGPQEVFAGPTGVWIANSGSSVITKLGR